jgi:hypothetical protein
VLDLGVRKPRVECRALGHQHEARIAHPCTVPQSVVDPARLADLDAALSTDALARFSHKGSSHSTDENLISIVLFDPNACGNRYLFNRVRICTRFGIADPLAVTPK